MSASPTAYITACGLVSPWGLGLSAFSEGLAERRTLVGHDRTNGRSTAPGDTIAEASEWNPRELLPEARGLREFDRTALLLASATALALRDATDALNGSESTGIVIGSTFGPISSIADFDSNALSEGPMYVRPLAFPNTVLNAPAGRVGKLFGIKGVNATISTGETSGLDALIYGCEWLGEGRAQCVLAGSGFGVSPLLARAFRTPLGEGATVFLLEPQADAKARRPYARIDGFATVFLPERADRQELATWALHNALERAGTSPSRIDLVVVGEHGPEDSPDLERAALRRTFGTAPPPVQGFREFLGDCLDAAGGFQLAAAILALAAGARTVLVSALSRAGHCAYVVLSRGENWA